MRMAVHRLAGLGEANVEYFRGVELKNAAGAAANMLASWAARMTSVQQSPFLGREDVSRVAARLATIEQIRTRLRSVTFSEMNRDTMKISTNEQDVLDAIAAANREVEIAKTLEHDARRSVTIRAAIAGFSVLTVVGGGLWFYSASRR